LADISSGFYFYESTFQVTAAQASSSLLTLSCITLIIPAAYHASEADGDTKTPWLYSPGTDPEPTPSSNLLILSRGTALMLLGTYIAYLIFQLRTHSGLFEAEEEEEEIPEMDKYSAGAWLLIVTVVTAFAADTLVGSIDETAEQWHLPPR
jgi:Ca2+:H+ antiporter